MNWKWMMMAGVLAASMAFAACGDDDDEDNLPPCDVTADCASGEVCVGADGAKVCRDECTADEDCGEGRTCRADELDVTGTLACFRDSSGTACFDELDCEEGQVCVDSVCQEPAACEEDVDCREGESCVEGACIPDEVGGTCETTADCIDNTEFCSTATSECTDASCSASYNTCSRCTSGPNGGDRAPEAPLVVPAQVDLVGCTQDDRCDPGSAPWTCEFAFLAFDVEGDLPMASSQLSGENGRIRVLSSSGSQQPVFGTSATPDANDFTRYTFTACFPETSSGNIGTAAFLRDLADNPSNTLCVNGSLPL